MRTALVCGAGGFIGHHFVRKLKTNGYYVRGIDYKRPEFSPTAADDFLVLDLRNRTTCEAAVSIADRPVDEVYNFAADMGGMGFIHSAACELMRNNALININMIQASAEGRVGRYFFASSVCVYRDMAPGEPEICESDAIPAAPDNEYGWEKLYAERMAMAHGRQYEFPVRIARFQNCYGPEGTWQGGREKAPAAICRKVAEVDDGGVIEVWGDGTAIRSYIYVLDLIEAVYILMHSDLEGPTNIGISEYVSVKELVDIVAAVAQKTINIRYIDGPVGVQSRNFSHARIESLGWRPHFSLRRGIEKTYPWIAQQVAAADLVHPEAARATVPSPI